MCVQYKYKKWVFVRFLFDFLGLVKCNERTLFLNENSKKNNFYKTNLFSDFLNSGVKIIAWDFRGGILGRRPQAGTFLFYFTEFFSQNSYNIEKYNAVIFHMGFFFNNILNIVICKIIFFELFVIFYGHKSF